MVKILLLKKESSGKKKEIIQIGALKFNKNYKILDKLNLYVRPRYNPVLSKYIKNLTGITQKKLDKKGLQFKKSYKIFKKFSKRNKILCNGDDNSIFRKNLHYNNINDKSLKIQNIKKILNKKYNIPLKFLHSPVIHTYFGYKLKKNEMHNAVNDCLCVLKALKKIKFCL